MSSPTSAMVPYYGYQSSPQYYQSGIPMSETSSPQSSGGAGMIGLIAVCLLSCVASSIAGVYLVGGKCGDKSSIIGFVHSKWWMWILASVPLPPMFPVLITIKLLTWTFC